MPRLPSAGDVQNVPLSRDPGASVPGISVPRTQVPQTRVPPPVQVPQGAFDSGIGIAAQELAPGLANLAEAVRRQESRKDTVDRAKKYNQYRDEAEKQFLELNSTKNFSDDSVLSEYGTFLSERRQALLNEHQGSNESKAELEVLLLDVESKATGKAAATSVAIGLNELDKTHTTLIDPLLQNVARDPSVKNIESAFFEVDKNLSIIRGGIDPIKEDEYRKRDREEIALSAINSLISRGRIEQAESLMQSGLSLELSPETERDIVRRVESFRFAKDEFMRKKVGAETFLGRPLNESESLGMLGIQVQRDPNDLSVKKRQAEESLGRSLNEEETLRLFGIEPKEGKITDKQMEIINMLNRGLDPNLAMDIANEHIRVVGPDNFGNFYRVNTVTNERELIPVAQSKVINDIATEAAEQIAETQNKGRSIEKAAITGTGPIAKIQAGISNVVGPFVAGAMFEDTTKARQQLKTFNQTAKTALVNNPKFPVAEQEIVAALLPEPDVFLKDPDTARSNLIELGRSLNGFKSAKEKELQKTDITTNRRAELTDQISRIDEMLSLMEPSGSEVTVNTQAEVDALDPGTEFIWGPTGDKLRKD